MIFNLSVDDYENREHYSIENVSIEMAHFVKPTELPNFMAVWESLSEENQETHELLYPLKSTPSLTAAVLKILSSLGMAACEDSGNPSSSKTKHTLFASGMVNILASDPLTPVLAICYLIFDPEEGVGIRVEIKSIDLELSQCLMHGLCH